MNETLVKNPVFNKETLCLHAEIKYYATTRCFVIDVDSGEVGMLKVTPMMNVKKTNTHTKSCCCIILSDHTVEVWSLTTHKKCMSILPTLTGHKRLSYCFKLIRFRERQYHGFTVLPGLPSWPQNRHSRHTSHRKSN